MNKRALKTYKPSKRERKNKVEEVSEDLSNE